MNEGTPSGPVQGKQWMGTPRGLLQKDQTSQNPAQKQAGSGRSTLAARGSSPSPVDTKRGNHMPVPPHCIAAPAQPSQMPTSWLCRSLRVPAQRKGLLAIPCHPLPSPAIPCPPLPSAAIPRHMVLLHQDASRHPSKFTSWHWAALEGSVV